MISTSIQPTKTRWWMNGKRCWQLRKPELGPVAARQRSVDLDAFSGTQPGPLRGGALKGARVVAHRRVADRLSVPAAEPGVGHRVHLLVDHHREDRRVCNALDVEPSDGIGAKVDAEEPAQPERGDQVGADDDALVVQPLVIISSP